MTGKETNHVSHPDSGEGPREDDRSFDFLYFVRARFGRHVADSLNSTLLLSFGHAARIGLAKAREGIRKHLGSTER